ncbi:MAG: 16S rRNA (adenine(1518)-N(6)/adenine(1519)-N(6))-dimethyltransferase RsmA [Actinomycetaceae bacterium]|nr:16S rRNA (adenine(1518)-N(6)/adenine(1519)-N(6))-dimethyltransferase RsmA [Actinomycetaceae bacterium]
MNEVNLLTPTNVREICSALHIQPTKTLGQNFVHDAGTVRKIVSAANVSEGEHVLEIGPGLGSLTLGLLEGGARVTAIEIDPVLATALPATVQGHAPGAPLRVLHSDALKVRSIERLNEAKFADGSTEQWEAPTRLVANLPYNIAVPLVLGVLEYFPTITQLLVMVQTEVAQRLSAQPGSKIYGVPSVKVAWYGHAELAGSISRNVFWPVPNVDSSLVRITRYDADEPGGGAQAPDTAGVDRDLLFEIVDVAFAQRRKTLRSALKKWAGGAEQAETLLAQADIDPQKRGETLGIDQFLALARAAQSRATASGAAHSRASESGAAESGAAAGVEGDAQ